MQNKSALLIFTVLLALSTLYILSFSWVSSRFEGVAKEYSLEYKDSLSALYSGSQLDSALNSVERKFLKDSANAEIYPLLGHSYEYVKKRELNLGLDLRGGMSVVLEVSLPDLVTNLSDYNSDETFLAAIAGAKEMQKSSQDDFITLFERSWNDIKGDKELWRIFHNLDNKDKFASGITDEEVFTILRAEAETAINNTESIIRRRIDKFGVAQPVVQKQSFSGRILVELPGVDDRDRVRKNLVATANLEFWETYKNNEVAQSIVNMNTAIAKSLNPEVFVADSLKNVQAADTTITADSLEDQVLDADALSKDSTNVDEILDLSDGSEDAASDSTPEQMSDAEIAKRAPLFRYFQLNNTSGSPLIGFVKESDTSSVNRLLSRPEAKQQIPADLRLMWAAKPSVDGFFAMYAIKDASLKGKPKLDGASIVDAFQDFDEYGVVSVSMNMDNNGALIWGQMTREAAAQKNSIAIVMDRLVYSAPTVNEEISGGRSQITLGAGTLQEQLQEAKDLSDLLKAGALPAPAKIVDESVVGPSLGSENIKSGILSFVIALIVVLLYMIFYYGKAGVVSNIALIANLFFLMGALASLGAALTLPGIAGIVLTIGMAVDTNVLIFERIREEMRSGKGVGMALKDGYRNAYSSIIDANITTLLTGIVLFVFGTGPIRGFATTLIIGILTSLFSGILITRLIFFSRLEKKKPMTFQTNITKNWFLNINYPFVQKRKIFYVISGVVILLGVVSLAVRNLNYGVDFQGGRSYVVRFDNVPDMDALRSNLSEVFTEEGTKGNPEVKRFGGSGEAVKITTNFMINSEDAGADSLVNLQLTSGLDKSGIGYLIENTQKVDPTISDDFAIGARNATLFSVLIIFLYIFVRFRKWQFAVGALAAMLHDVIIVLSVFSIFYGILPFTMEVDQAFIAAILTVIGYSINDTVVVFDRIREYLKEHHKEDSATVINKALNSTLGRTINTSLTTFMVLLIIFIFGPANIMGFVFALMVGIAVGTYSSLFVATPIVVDLSKDIKA